MTRSETKPCRRWRRRRNRQFAFFSFQFALFNIVLWLAGALTTTIPAQTPAQSPKPEQDVDVIRTETELTNLLFTVTDKNNRYITELQKNDIRVLEDGAPQTVFTFQRETDRPLTIALMIDVSISEERTLPDEKAAARTFIQNVIKSDKDQAAIIPFEGYAHLEQFLTRDVIKLYTALEHVEVASPEYMGSGPRLGGIVSGPGTISPPIEGSTAIWDSIALTCRNVLARSNPLRRRAIIILTDGDDTSSRLARTVAADEAVQTDTVIYAIGIGDKRYNGINKSALSSLAERTGGRAFFPKKEDDVGAAFAEIELELRSQYLVAYSPTNKNHDGAYRKLTIEVANPDVRKEGLKLHYRPGYFARTAGH